MMPKKQDMIAYYEKLFNKHGYHYRALDWKGEKGMETRYYILSTMLEMFGEKKVTALDLGSGLGHLYGYLKQKKLIDKYAIQYTGYDISPKLVEAAQAKYPEAKFEVKDILEGYFTERFDYVFCSGVFNIILTDVQSHSEFVHEMLKRMYESSKIGVAVNFLSEPGKCYAPDDEQGEKNVYHYFKPEDIVSFARSFCTRFILRHDYSPGDFTLYLLKGR